MDGEIFDSHTQFEHEIVAGLLGELRHHRTRPSGSGWPGANLLRRACCRRILHGTSLQRPCIHSFLANSFAPTLPLQVDKCPTADPTTTGQFFSFFEIHRDTENQQNLQVHRKLSSQNTDLEPTNPLGRPSVLTIPGPNYSSHTESCNKSQRCVIYSGSE